MILLISSMGGNNLLPRISLGPDTVKHYRQFKNIVFQKHQIMLKACHPKLQNPDNRNDPNLEEKSQAV